VTFHSGGIWTLIGSEMHNVPRFGMDG